jgi:hypothetical protein
MDASGVAPDEEELGCRVGLGREPRLMTAGLSAGPDPAIASSLPACLSRRSTGPRREITAGSRSWHFLTSRSTSLDGRGTVISASWPKPPASLSVGRENLARRLYLAEGYRVVPAGSASDPESETMIKDL